VSEWTIRLRKYSPAELSYAASARCRCGAGLAYPDSVRCLSDEPRPDKWMCARVLLGEVPDSEGVHVVGFGERPGAYPEAPHDAFPFWCWEIKSECQPSADGRTTRPAEQGRIHSYNHHTCKACGHVWDSPPHPPHQPAAPAIEYPDCPSCGEWGYRRERGMNGQAGTRDVRVRNVLVPS
jgi:hypothetical protein